MAQHFAERVSAVGPLGEALDGTPPKKVRAARRANPNSEVTTNVVCYCQARFDDLVEFSTHVRGGCPDLIRVSALRDRSGRRLVATCGTASGYQRHWRRGEPTCEECRAAVRESQLRANPNLRDYQRQYQREWRARKKAERSVVAQTAQ